MSHDVTNRNRIPRFAYRAASCIGRGAHGNVSRRRAERRTGRALSPGRFPRRRTAHRAGSSGVSRVALRAAVPRRVRNRPLPRRMELARGKGRRRPHPPDLQRLEVGPCGGAGGPPSLHRPVVRPASRVAGGTDQPGQRAVEAARRARPRLPPGRQLPAVGGAARDVQLLDRARRDQCLGSSAPRAG